MSKLIKIKDLKYCQIMLNSTNKEVLYNDFDKKFLHAKFEELTYFSNIPGLYDVLKDRLFYCLPGLANSFAIKYMCEDFIVIDGGINNLLEGKDKVLYGSFDPTVAEARLIEFLSNSTIRIGGGLFTVLNLLYQVYPMRNFSFVDYEFSLIKDWIGNISAIDELLLLVKKVNPVFNFESLSDTLLRGHFSLWVSIFSYKQPVKVEDAKKLPIFFMHGSSSELSSYIIAHLLSEGSFIEMLYEYIAYDYRFKYRIVERDKKKAVNNLLTIIFEDISLETLRFLAVNLPETSEALKDDVKNFPEVVKKEALYKELVSLYTI